MLPLHADIARNTYWLPLSAAAIAAGLRIKLDLLKNPD